MVFQVFDRVELPYLSPLWQEYREAIVMEITQIPGGQIMVKVQEVRRRTLAWFSPERLKPWRSD